MLRVAIVAVPRSTVVAAAAATGSKTARAITRATRTASVLQPDRARLVPFAAIPYAGGKANGSRAAGREGDVFGWPRSHTRTRGRKSDRRTRAEASLVLRARGCVGRPRGGRAREARYQELRSAFVANHGEITDAYICESGPMAVAVTTVHPQRFGLGLLRARDRIEMYTETERLVRMHPEVAQILHRGRCSTSPSGTHSTEPAAARELALRLDARFR